MYAQIVSSVIYGINDYKLSDFICGHTKNDHKAGAVIRFEIL